jgi:hypothetical protein
MTAPTYTVQIIMDAPEFAFCPKCGIKLFTAPVMITNGPEAAVKVCPKCEIAWPIQED